MFLLDERGFRTLPSDPDTSAASRCRAKAGRLGLSEPTAGLGASSANRSTSGFQSRVGTPTLR
ncbi:hypothetical protein LZ30DRAFT_734770 [Colletotrichum cereale]|nr:hypothetical protein LZ30DRAFT_734770 [Colletotrichum cereale]